MRDSQTRDGRPKQKYKPPSTTAFTVLLLIFIVVLLVLAFLYVGREPNSALGNVPPEAMELPPIEVGVASADNARTQHTIRAQFAVSSNTNNDAVPSEDEEILNNWIQEEMKTLDYDEIAGEDGHTFLKRRLSDVLSEKLGYSINVYVTNYVADISFGQGGAESKSKEDARNEKVGDALNE